MREERPDIERLESKLDLLIALLRIAHREEIEDARQVLLADDVAREVLRAAQRGPIEAGELKSRAMKQSRASKPTVERRIAELVARGALRRSGAGGSVTYSATGLFEL